MKAEIRKQRAVTHAAGRDPEAMKITPHPPSYLGHPLPRCPRGKGGDPAKRESRVRGFFKAVAHAAGAAPRNHENYPSPPFGRGWSRGAGLGEGVFKAVSVMNSVRCAA
jgi:hypothetical protein